MRIALVAGAAISIAIFSVAADNETLTALALPTALESAVANLSETAAPETATTATATAAEATPTARAPDVRLQCQGNTVRKEVRQMKAE
ncbi:MAG: hypothetical protein SGCHY_002154, partial [Lobulomycetales sp.]